MAISRAAFGCAALSWLTSCGVLNTHGDLQTTAIWDGLDASLAPQRDATGWVRVHASDGIEFDRDLLVARVHQAMTDCGWHYTSIPAEASHWIDVRVRYWGLNPKLDDGATVRQNMSDGLRPLADGSKSRGREESVSETNPLGWFDPIGVLVVRALTDPIEWDLVLDIRIRQRGVGELRGRLTSSARRLDLDEQEATYNVCGEVETALVRLFEPGA